MLQSMKIAAYSRAAAISTASRPLRATCAVRPRWVSSARATTELISLSSAISTSCPASSTVGAGTLAAIDLADHATWHGRCDALAHAVTAGRGDRAAAPQVARTGTTHE